MSAAPLPPEDVAARCASCGHTAPVRWRAGRWELTRHHCGPRLAGVDAEPMIAAWARGERERELLGPATDHRAERLAWLARVIATCA